MTVAEKAPVAERGAWLETIETLLSEVEAWASSRHWSIKRRSKAFTEELAQDEYTVPVLEIVSPCQPIEQPYSDTLVLEPAMFNPRSGVERIDFYVWPAMYRVRMIHQSGQDGWTIKTDSGINWPLPWNEQTFVQIAEGLFAA